MKNELRKTGLEKRNKMSQNEVKELSNQIIKQIKNKFDLNLYHTLAFYMPLGNEVDLRPLMDELITLNKIIVVPKVFDRFTMDFYQIQTTLDVHTGKFKVLEPNSNKKIPKNEIDIIFIPGIHFSYQNNRLGYGAGYYDRYLKDYDHVKIGVCFSFQHIPLIPADSYDIPMDWIITENPLHLHHDED